MNFIIEKAATNKENNQAAVVGWIYNDLGLNWEAEDDEIEEIARVFADATAAELKNLVKKPLPNAPYDVSYSQKMSVDIKKAFNEKSGYYYIEELKLYPHDYQGNSEFKSDYRITGPGPVGTPEHKRDLVEELRSNCVSFLLETIENAK